MIRNWFYRVDEDIKLPVGKIADKWLFGSNTAPCLLYTILLPCTDIVELLTRLNYAVARVKRWLHLRMLRTTRPVHHILRQFYRIMSTNEIGSRGTVEITIHEKLATLLQPSQLTITNESHLHRHHAAMRAQGGGNGETHFAVQVISDAFKGMNTVQRHRMIYSALSDELAQGLHALSLKTKTPEEAQRLAAEQAA
ncbi:hypothetical protein HYDPIDRAFT_107482 [Hydnomerulius pinastri MD-312]|nr:hypothetical protein HYDPIDRAFT_107482 [Hydnomerulius pinastri MD-312]